MILSIFTIVHVIISLVGIASGVVVMAGLLTRKRLDGYNALFLATTVATSVTGFGFPFHRFLPSHGVGLLSLVVLGLALAARYRFRLTGGWRKVYGTCAVVVLYFNMFVLVVQSFQKVPVSRAVAPTQSEPPFVVAQSLVLVAFIVLGVLVASRSRPEALRVA